MYSLEGLLEWIGMVYLLSLMWETQLPPDSSIPLQLLLLVYPPSNFLPLDFLAGQPSLAMLNGGGAGQSPTASFSDFSLQFTLPFLGKNRGEPQIGCLKRCPFGGLYICFYKSPGLY